MNGRPVQDIRIWKLQHRPANRRPWLVRWGIDGKQRSRSFITKAPADRYRSHLLVAVQEGRRFDPETGEPETWAAPATGPTVVEWARSWMAEEWQEWAPRTRRSQAEALARFVPLAVDPTAPAPPSGLRRYLMDTLGPVAGRDDRDDRERWLSRWSLPLTSLTPGLLAEVERRLGLGDEGQALAASTASRFRKVSRSCIRRAVDLDQLSSDPWPRTPKGRSTRKARRQRKAVDVRRLPDPATMVKVLEAIPTHQPGSLTYEAMSAVSYYAGLRPSEVVMLRPRAVHLAGPGEWGVVEVLDADDGYDEPADPKTGERSVPIPPVLADHLGRYIADRQVGPDALVFRTRNDRRPTASNWNRALKRAAAKVGHGPLSPYDCRHACATTWLKAGVPLGEAALRLGHSVETLVAYYVGALHGDDQVANELIGRAWQR